MKYIAARFFIISMIAGAGRLQAQSAVKWIVPAGGNSWVKTNKAGREEVSNDGWQNWEQQEAVWSTYIKVRRKGSLNIRVLLSVPSGKSRLRFTVHSTGHTLYVAGAADSFYTAGSWNIDAPGYVRIDAQGIHKTGNVFALVKALQIAGTAVDSSTAFVKNNLGNYFYWGRRGPSVHINYDMSEAGNEVEWFYNEITVPPGNDVIGSYFMADGFAEGYFGMQVNSETERRIIFSVWSPFKTDDPKAIPDNQQIVLVKKGEQVDAGVFGNEGSGGHSHLIYNWKAGETYKFLLRGRPIAGNFTSYTAFFYDNTASKWLLIASFNRPATNTYLKRLHSFLENFEPATGNITRKAYYHDQWVKPSNGDWLPLYKMVLTADATANKGYRMDYDGGVENGWFFMKNGGFFNESATLKKTYTVEKPLVKPDIRFAALDLPD